MNPLDEMRYRIKSERDHAREGNCEWPVETYFYGDPGIRKCGRAGSGHAILLCWQHADRFRAEVLAQILAFPNYRFGEAIVDWITGALSDYQPDWWTDEQREEHARSRQVAQTAAGELSACLELDQLPPAIRERLDDRLRALVDERLSERWSA